MQDISLKGFTAESRSQFDRINADVDALEADLARLEAVEARTAEARSFVRSPRPGVNDHYGRNALDSMSVEERKQKTGEAFRSYLIHGAAAMPAEQRDLLTTGAAGAVIPQDFLPQLVEAQKFYGRTPSLLKQRRTPGTARPMKIAISNDTANGVTLIGESTAVTEVDPAFQSIILGSDTITSGLVLVSVQELEDSYFSLDRFLTESFAKRFGRGTEKAVTLGVDTNGTVLPNQIAGGLVAGTVVGTTTTALANGIGWDDLTALYSALDPAYTQNPVWLMNSATRGYLIGLKDGFGRPYFQISPGDSKPFQSILGYEIVLNQSMPNMGANAVPVIFGSLDDAAIYRTDGDPTVLRLSERYMDTLQVGFFAYQRIASASIVASGQPNPLVSLKQAAD